MDAPLRFTTIIDDVESSGAKIDTDLLFDALRDVATVSPKRERKPRSTHPKKPTRKLKNVDNEQLMRRKNPPVIHDSAIIDVEKYGRIGGTTSLPRRFAARQNSPSQSTLSKVAKITENIRDPELKAMYETLYHQVTEGPTLKPTVTFDDIKHRLPYSEHNKIKKTSLHLGQRKLFMNELQFLTQYVDKNERVLCVYAGAAPSHKAGLLSDLFPNVTFLLVDPARFDIIGKNATYLSSEHIFDVDEAEKIIHMIKSDPIYIINGFFTNALASTLPKIVNIPILFISDIRTLVHDEDRVSTQDIIWNMSSQYNWVNLINARASMLKFRHPFYQDMSENFREQCEKSPYREDFELSKFYGIDFVTDAENHELNYLDGKLYIQPWAGVSSTESRHVSNSLKICRHIPLSEYEDKFYYYNNIERCYVKHVNDHADRSLGFDLCNDCSLENHIWKQYILKHQSRYGVKTLVAMLSKATKGKELLKEDHGKFF